MQDYEKGFIALAVMGALIALGKMLSSGEPITLRLVAGRVIVGSALSVAAGWHCTLSRIFIHWHWPGLVPRWVFLV